LIPEIYFFEYAIDISGYIALNSIIKQ